MRDDVNRRHSIFGDYILVDKNKSSGSVSNDTSSEIRDYNALWSRYAKDVSGKWGAIPTEKGFEKWLQKKVKDAER